MYSIAYICLFSVVFFASRKLTGHYLSPPALITLQWTFFLVFALAAGFRYIEDGMELILLFTVFFLLGFYTLKYPDKVLDVRISIQQSRFFSLLLLSQIVSLTGAFLYLKTIIEAVGSIQTMFIIGGIVRENIQLGEIDIPLMIRVLSYFVFPNLILSFLYFFLYRRKYFIWLTALNILIITFAMMGRFYLLLGMLFSFWCWYFGISMFQNRKLRSVDVKILKIIPVVLLAVFISFAGIERIRIGEQYEIRDYVTLIDKIPVYTSGQISALGYFNTHYQNEDLLWGQMMFSGIFDLLKIADRPPGLYRDFIIVSDRGDEGNVFTGFRVFMDDFSYPGFFLISYLIGLFCSVCYYKITRERRFFFYLNSSYFFTFLVWLFVTSITIYNSMIFGLFYLNLFVWFLRPEAEYSNHAS